MGVLWRICKGMLESRDANYVEVYDILS
jgi:hypothetical protein